MIIQVKSVLRIIVITPMFVIRERNHIIKHEKYNEISVGVN